MKGMRILLFLALAAVASAGSVTFDFNSLSPGATTTQIANYMTAVLQAAGCTGCTTATVTVTGAAADQNYNGEGYVVGPGGKSLTLGTSNNATSNSSTTVNSTYDTFIANTNDSSTQISNEITIKFSGFTINGSVGFDYEIFPDGSCTALPCGSNTPDFEFDTSGSNPVTSFGTNGIQYGVTPSSSGSDGSSTKGPNGTIVAPQYIGTWSGSLSGVNELDFIDWPATIGVDNLTVSWNTPVPDPSSVLLLGTVVAGIALRKKLRKTA